MSSSLWSYIALCYFVLWLGYMSLLDDEPIGAMPFCLVLLRCALLWWGYRPSLVCQWNIKPFPSDHIRLYAILSCCALPCCAVVSCFVSYSTPIMFLFFGCVDDEPFPLIIHVPMVFASGAVMCLGCGWVILALLCLIMLLCPFSFALKMRSHSLWYTGPYAILPCVDVLCLGCDWIICGGFNCPSTNLCCCYFVPFHKLWALSCVWMMIPWTWCCALVLLLCFLLYM